VPRNRQGLLFIFLHHRSIAHDVGEKNSGKLTI
jgi:hypothetical protein